MFLAYQRLGAEGCNSSSSRFSTTSVAPLVAFEQVLKDLRILALSS
jgi:hypothetical protein